MKNKEVFYVGLSMILVGIVTCMFQKDLATLWISGSGATIIALVLLLNRLTLDWNQAFQELNGKFNGTTDCVRACYADISVMKDEIRTLSPDQREELEMRIENLEAMSGIKNFGKAEGQDFEFKPYRPKEPPKLKS